MKKTAAEAAIRRLVHEWAAKATGFDGTSGEQPSFLDFKSRKDARDLRRKAGRQRPPSRVRTTANTRC